jgi:integrase
MTSAWWTKTVDHGSGDHVVAKTSPHRPKTLLLVTIKLARSSRDETSWKNRVRGLGLHLPPFLVALLTEHRERNPKARFVFTGAEGGLHRRSNFRRRVWLPAFGGDPELGRGPINQELHFHDLRHTHDG